MIRPVVAVIQCRMGSSRLPGKVLELVADIPLLGHVIRRVQHCRLVDRVVVATTEHPSDDAIASYGVAHGVPVFRGSVDDVLDRFYQVATRENAGTLVRITADCPLLDPTVVDMVIERFADANCDYASNVAPPTFPDGLDVEVFSFTALADAWREASLTSEREHVTPYIRNHPEKFPQINVSSPEDYSSIRLTVDEPADLALVRKMYDRAVDVDFGLREVLDILAKEPSLLGVNQGIGRNEGYERSLNADVGGNDES